MGIRSMVQFTARVAALLAVAALLLQTSCTIAASAPASAQTGTQSDSGCHESAPPAQNSPEPNHICCAGDHSVDALLSATATSAPLALDEAFLTLNSALPSFAITSIHFSSSLSPPHRPLSLRI
jgi:hypothetical protein